MVVVVVVVVGVGRDARRGTVRAAIGAAAAKGSPTDLLASRWATSISFGRTSAVARLAPATTTRATAIALTPANARRTLTGRSRCSRRHPRRKVPRRIGVSMIRKEISVTTAEIASAATNSATDSGRPDTSRMIW